MAECSSALEGWEWENIFTSTLLENDLPWHEELSEPDSMIATATHSIDPLSLPSSAVPTGLLPVKSRQEREGEGTPRASSAVIATNTSDGSLDSSGYNHDTPVSSHHLPSSETSLVNSAASLSKKKKRDPRLECPNFLAGRIPCSCPEEDELEEDNVVKALVKKRSKVGARCQVPSCGEDISHLKGYHQRHRVCLGCANSSKVMLKDQPHRYCQQCGKFHRLSDFDEGKRSCRRKLERHNKRRRRRPVDEEGDFQDCEAQLCGIDIDCSNLHLSQEGAPTKIVQTAAPTIGRSLPTHHAKHKKKGSATGEERNTAASITQSSDLLPSDILQKEVEGITQDLTNPVADDQRASDDSSGSVRRFEEDIISSNQGELDEHCLLNVLLGHDNEQALRDTHHPLKSETSKRSYILTNQSKRTDYVSPYPTGRISFKLYDWNPADFPRRLRQQIFEWLSNMPVELESYVRSGCIILTFFITMPQSMWDKVLAEWKEQVQTFIHKSGVKLLGTGQLTTQTVEKTVLVKNGKATGVSCKDDLAPFVVDLYPCSLEAGCRTQIYVFGFNFSGGKFFLSFGEHYVECSGWESVDDSHVIARKGSFVNMEVHKVSVFLPDSKKFGLAHVEVESVHGLSNFVPILVADKSICSEINLIGANHASAFNICADVKDELGLRSHFCKDMVTDLGWALKYAHTPHPIDKVEVKEVFIRRLQTLLLFSIEHPFHAITRRLVQTAVINFVPQNVYCVRGLVFDNISKTFKHLKAIRISGLSGPCSGTPVKTNFTPRLEAEADSTQAIDRPIKTKGLEGANCAVVEQLPSIPKSAQVGGFCESRFLPLEVPLLEERIHIAGDGWRPKACWAWSSRWSRNSGGTTGTSIICTGNRKFARILVATVGVVTLCTGMCIMLQHPHEVAEISMSLRRCLWGSSDVHHV